MRMAATSAAKKYLIGSTGDEIASMVFPIAPTANPKIVVRGLNSPQKIHFRTRNLYRSDRAEAILG